MGLVLVVLALVVGGCTRDPPEQRLREAVAGMQAAVEAGDAKGFMRGVAEDFSGNAGTDRAGLGQMLRGHLVLNRKVGIQTGPLSVEIRGATAVVRFTVVLTGSGGRLLPERGQLQTISSGWRDVDGHWQLYHAQWQPHGGVE